MEADLRTISERLDRIERATLMSAKPVIGVEEAALFTGFSVRGIYDMSHERRIPHYKRGGRLLFKKDELVAWMTTHKVKTTEQIDSEAVTYTVLN